MICADCSELAFHLNKGRGWWGRSTDLDLAWKTFEQLLECDAYKNCDLCKAYVSLMTGSDDGLVELLNSHRLRKRPVRVSAFWKGDIDQKTDSYVLSYVLFVGWGVPVVVFRLWREQISSSDLPYYENRQKIRKQLFQRLISQGSLAQAAPKSQPYEGVSWAKPIMDVRGPETAAQLRFWLWKCVNDHPKCRVALSGERFGMYSQTSSLDQCNLPSRILDVGSADSLLVRLVETTTETPSASYVALSHCWGPPDKQPLRTTLDTLEDYIQSGIPLARLPRTFSDAVWVTRELGIRYLWIDSLCIIQDSPSDWEAESEKMGSIYEGATLTLGAAYARDSSEGLFKGLQRPDPEKVVKIYTHMEGYSALAPYATCFLSEPNFWAENTNAWYDSPLAKRAWVMQEWSLSRRFVWSEDKSLHWKCREETKAEPCVTKARIDVEVGYDDASLGYIPSFDVLTNNWHRLIRDYTRMQLTYETDRLVALRGIVTALRGSYRKDQEYHFGIWLEGHKTLSLLFWTKTDLHSDSPLNSCLPEIPSWSWASVVDQITLSPDDTKWAEQKTRYYYDNRGITASNNGTELHFRAPIGVVQLCLHEDYDELCRHKSASRYRRMSIYITNSSPNGTDSEGIESAMTLGRLSLDYTIDVLDCPTPSGIAHHVIPLVRQPDNGIYSTDSMLVVEPANKPDGSKAYRRVGVGHMYVVRSSSKASKVKWSYWNKMLSEMKIEDIVLV